MKRFEFSCFVTITAASEGEARGKLGQAQELLEENLPEVELSIEDGAPLDISEEET